MKAATTARGVQRLPAWARAGAMAAAITLFLAVLAIVPVVPVRPYLDFQVLYQTDMGLLRGIPVYDHAGQVQMIAGLAGVAPEQVFLLPFPYPPWYALFTAWLAWLPIEAAARVWFGINLLLLFASIALLTEGWSLTKRAAAFGLGFFFLPVLGSLLVGQYGFPLLLGAALMAYALRHEHAMLAAVGGVLLTFKPHLGALILLAALIHLWRRKDAFGKRAILHLLVAGALLFMTGFLADPAWPVNYARSLVEFQSAGGVPSCALCAGLPAWIATRISPEQGLRLRLEIGVVMLAALTAWWLWKRGHALQRPSVLVAASSLIVLLSSPYLLNYDFLLMLVPLALLTSARQSIAVWLLLGLAYLLPFAMVGLLGRQGNFAFALSAVILMVVLYCKSQVLDVSPAAS